LFPLLDDSFPEYTWLGRDLPHDEISWPAVAKVENRYILRFAGLADFEFAPSSQIIRCFSASHVPSHTISHLLIDQVLPRALGHMGELVIHASAVVVDGGTIAFLGPTGLGKSTLCASFCDQGFSLVTDDSLLLKTEDERIMAYASYPGLRLWSDSVAMLSEAPAGLSQVAHYTDKKFLNVTDSSLAFGEEATPLHAVFVLAPPEDHLTITIEPIPSRDIAIEILKAAFTLDSPDKHRLKQDFLHFTRIANMIPFYRLSYPRDPSRLPEVRRAILNHTPQAH
jgi:hypothetical protein